MTNTLKECLKEIMTSNIIVMKIGLITDVGDLGQLIPKSDPELKTEDAQFKYINFLSNIITDVINTLHNEDNNLTCDPAGHMMGVDKLYACTWAAIRLAYDETVFNNAEANLSIIAPFDMAKRFLAYLTRRAAKYGIMVVPIQVWSPLML
jgi:hypothetical protein